MNLTVVPPIEIKLVVADAESIMTIAKAKNLSKGLNRRENGIVITRECNDSLKYYRVLQVLAETQ